MLDVLSNSDNNVQKAADRLVKMGYVKRDTPSAPRLHARRKEEERLAEKRTPLPKPPPIKTEKEKDDLRRKMKDKYEKKYQIPERILFMALESVLYDEDQANNLIQAMIDDDLKRQKAKEAEKAKEKEKKPIRKSPKPVRKALDADKRHASPKKEPKKPLVIPSGHGKKGFSGPKAKDGEDQVDRGSQPDDDSVGMSMKAKGPNPDLRKGPNDDLLLTDYVTWNGPDPTLRHGPDKASARGPNPSLRKGPKGASINNGEGAKGPNPTLRKGPNPNLVKGSVFGTSTPIIAVSSG